MGLKLSSIIIGFIIGLGIGYFVWNSNIPVNTKYDLLDAKNDSLEAVNWRLDQEYSKLNLKADSINLGIENQKEGIIYIKQKQSEAINHIDDLTGDELFSFFAGIKLSEANSLHTK